MKNNKQLFIIFILLFILLSLISPDRFLTIRNMKTMAFQLPEFALITLGMMIVILTGGINLSITFASALSGIMAAYVLVNYDFNVWIVILFAFLLAFLVALLTGLLNGLIVAYIGVTPILVTLGTGTLFEGISLKFTRGGTISGFSEQFSWIGNGTFLGFPIPILIFLVVAIFTFLLLERTPWGKKVYMLGSNSTAANFSGINVKKILLQVYIYSSLMAGIASIIMISRYNTAKVDLGSSYLLQSVSATVLGGTSISGGTGTVSGTIIALLILQMISSGLNVLGVNRFFIDIIMGAILILVLTIDYFSNKAEFINGFKSLLGLSTQG
ncbi:MAG: ABC transporter permease [Firmicutes bacterium]|nr:ABC transporter permease [Bacillota bacterium]